MKKKVEKKASESSKQIHNRKAGFDYQIDETYEAGMVLQGAEVKSLYLGRANLTDAYCRIIDGEAWILNLDIEPYEQAVGFLEIDRRRDRKLLLKKAEIGTLERKAKEKGYTLIPLKIYFSNAKRPRAKVLVGLGRGRSSYEKRDKIAKDETRRDVERLKRELR